MAVDKELLAIQRVLKNLEPLTLEEKLRVVNYIVARLNEHQAQHSVLEGESHNG